MYRVIPDDAVFEQVAALPFEALPSYAEALTVLEIAPANGRPYLMLDEAREVHVLLVQWVG